MNDEYCYAKQFLAEQGVELYRGTDRILKWEGKPNYKLFEFKTEIEKGVPLSETTSRKLINSYKELQRLGFMIIARPTEYDERTYPQQKVIYEIIPLNKNIKDVGEIPRKTYQHYIEYDVENKKVRLIGMSAGIPRRPGRGPWTQIPDKNPQKKVNVYNSFHRYLDKGKVNNILTNLKHRLVPADDKPEFINIPEIPFMITTNNEIVCLEDRTDPPVIAAVGARGSGKTMVVHTITDGIYNKNKGRPVALNDRQRQFLTWPLPNSVETFNRENQKVFHFPTPLPCIFLYPTDNNLRGIDFEEEKIGFEVTLPYESIIDNYKYFFQGRKNWDLGGSERYFKALRPELRKCRNIEQVKEVLENNLGDKSGKKGLKGTYEKLLKTMEDLFETKLLDISTDIPSKWLIKYEGKDVGKFFPISAALSVGLFPVVENGNIYSKDYYPQYMRWLIQDLYENLLNKRLPYNERTWMIIDEIGQIYKKNKVRTVAAEALIDTITEGRKPDLACLYTLQSWAKIDEEIQLNTTDVLAFNTNQSVDVAELASAFSLDKEEKEELKNLNTFECMAMTKKSWVVYDMDGNRYHTDETLKGKILFPTSQHTKVGQ